jgi:AcrR family transcriptional regulator
MSPEKGLRESPEKGLRERKKEQTRAAIAHAAVGLFLERGYDHVSIADIAAAAGVAKMTVTNYFPAKEDLVISAGGSVVPDLAGVVRGRRPGEPVLAALLRFVRAELDARAEWTALHDGVTQFTRMSMASPALSEAFARKWDGLQADLAQALEEATRPGAARDNGTGPEGAGPEGAGPEGAGPEGAGPEGAGPEGAGAEGAGTEGATSRGAAPVTGANAIPGGEMTLRVMKLLQNGEATESELAELTGWMTMSRVRAQIAAAQITGTLRMLTGANLIRQVAGLSADATAAQSHAETTAAFEMLESGLGRLYG